MRRRGLAAAGPGGTRNEIWRQMRSQRSIIFAPKGTAGGKRRSLLPAKRHVEDALRSKLARRVLLLAASSSLDDGGAPQPQQPQPWRGLVEAAAARLNGMWRDECQQALDCCRHGICDSGAAADDARRRPPLQFTAALRLREAPALTLRRAARLMLCATGGAGDMRGTGNQSAAANGWMSVVGQRIQPDGMGDDDEDSDDFSAEAAAARYLQGIYSTGGISRGLHQLLGQFQNLMLSPREPAWHRVNYPGLSARLGLASYPFSHLYESLPAAEAKCVDGAGIDIKNESSASCANGRETPPENFMTCIFESVQDFQLWELSVEVRAAVDYAVEMNDSMQYLTRRVAREQGETKDEKGENGKSTGNGTEEASDADAPDISRADLSFESQVQVHDSLGVLTYCGRKTLIERVVKLQGCGDSSEPLQDFSANGSPSSLAETISRSVEDGIRDLHNDQSMSSGRTAVPSVPVVGGSGSFENAGSAQGNSTRGSEEEGDNFRNDAQRILASVAVIFTEILRFRLGNMTENSAMRLIARPWLRHLCWEAVVAYVLYDTVPVLEKNGRYDIATSLLETILAGPGQSASDAMESSSDRRCSLFVQCLLSRRARGKAYDRLVIDRGHIARQLLKNKNAESQDKSKASNCAQGDSAVPKQSVKRRRTKRKHSNRREEECPRKEECTLTPVQVLCHDVLKHVGGSVPFSCIRSLARRLKKPLVGTISSLGGNVEMATLGIRAEEDAGCAGHHSDDPKRSGYCEWTPETDYSVANALVSPDTPGMGKRCSFVGWEDAEHGGGGEGIAKTRSLNVEELALEEYAAGRLPEGTKEGTGFGRDIAGGGWYGWHDEGSRARCLFRVLCSEKLLGWKSGTTQECDRIKDQEHLTVFLSPYQVAPLDLHVGHSERATDGAVVNKHTSWSAIVCSRPIRGFYERRKEVVHSFLEELEAVGAQGLCDLVYDSIVRRAVLAKSLGNTIVTKDIVLRRDFAETRTLSMIASGLGGKMLAAIIRSLCFDYRHYSGGLPDLLLARTQFSESESNAPKAFLGMGEVGKLVGESFSLEQVENGRLSQLANVLLDKDDEFLGCCKFGDSSIPQKRRSDNGQKRKQHQEVNNVVPLPERLALEFDDRKVHVQCLFVEVKSASDRLDPRQEDWLNVLSMDGNARVCKFESLATKKRREDKKSRQGTAK